MSTKNITTTKKITTTPQKKRRRVPVLDMGIECRTIVTLPEVRQNIFDCAVDAIIYGINNKRLEVDMYKVQGTSTFITLEKINWLGILTRAMKYYADMEQYKKACTCRDLVAQIENNK